MANDAHINFVGTVLQDPTNRQVNGNTVLSLRVAVQTTKRQEGSQYPASDIYDVSVWGKQAESLMERCKAKSKVYVNGDFMLGEPWTDRQNKEHQVLRVNNAQVKVLSGGSASAPANNNSNEEDEEAPF